MTLIPATMITGFLGAGKTTLIKRVLSEAHGHRIAVIENEFGEESIDGELLFADDQEQIVQMNNGCICCSIREDLRATLIALAERRERGELGFERVLIETTGLADPGPVAQTFFLDDDVIARYRPDAILTLVDAKHGMHQLDSRQEARKQVGFADHLFISKSDLVEQPELSGLERRLTAMNPRAPRKLVHFGEVALEDVFELRGFNLSEELAITPAPAAECDCRPGEQHDHEHEHTHSHDDVESFVFRSSRPLDPMRFGQFLKAAVNGYGDRMFRYKGVLDLAGTDRKVIFQGVHQLTSSDYGPRWSEAEERTSRLVFIGIGLPRELFTASLARCQL